jgi:hypothetical protein
LAGLDDGDPVDQMIEGGAKVLDGVPDNRSDRQGNPGRTVEPDDVMVGRTIGLREELVGLASEPLGYCLIELRPMLVGAINLGPATSQDRVPCPIAHRPAAI